MPKGFLAEVLQLPDDHSPGSPLQCNLLWCCCILNPLHPHPHCSQFFPPLQSSSNALSQSLFPGPWQHLTRAGQREQTGRTWGFCQLAVPVKLKCIILSLTCSFSQNTGSHRDFLQPQRNTFKCSILRRYFFPWSFFFTFIFLCLFSNLSKSTDISKLCCCCCCCFPPDAFLSHF